MTDVVEVADLMAEANKINKWAETHQRYNAMLDPDEQPHAMVQSARGSYVMAKALAYAIDAIDHLPEDKREWSDRQDMAHILRTVYRGLAPTVAQSVEWHTGRPVDLIDHKNVKE